VTSPILFVAPFNGFLVGLCSPPRAQIHVLHLRCSTFNLSACAAVLRAQDELSSYRFFSQPPIIRPV